MEGNSGMKKRMAKFFTFFVVTVSFICPNSVFGYWHTVHSKIASKAVEAADENNNLSEVLKQIGFNGGVKHEIRGFSTKSFKEWIEFGSAWEDFVIFWFYGYDPYKNIYNCHFYDPLKHKGLYKVNEEKQIEEIGQSLISRLGDNQNEWSYRMAKELFYAALTGNSTENSIWIMRDHHLCGPPFYGERNMSEEEREHFFAWTFQALGHSLHLIADSSVPAHTRNDSHGLIDNEPYEGWTRKHSEDISFDEIYYGFGSAPWSGWQDHSEIQVTDVFIDTDQLHADTSEPFTDLDQGLAEYSHANFLSKDTVFDSGLPSTLSGLHELAYPPYEKLGDSVFVEDKKEGDTVRRFVYVASRHAGGPEHFARCGILWHIKNSAIFPDYSPAVPDYTPLTGILYTADDDLVNKDYAEKLIPRAVGYSAGLLDYFFRGRLEISLPETGAYSVISNPDSLNDPSTQGFDRIRVCAKNVSAEGEDMSGGKLTAVVKYRLSQGNPFQNPPAGTSDEFYYVTGGTIITAVINCAF